MWLCSGLELPWTNEERLGTDGVRGVCTALFLVVVEISDHGSYHSAGAETDSKHTRCSRFYNMALAAMKADTAPCLL